MPNGYEMAVFAIPCHTLYNIDMATQTSMNISLPDTLRQWVEDRVAADGYGTASEYFRALVRDDQKRKAREQLDQKLVDALDSGEAKEMTAEDWRHIRSTVRERLAGKPSAQDIVLRDCVDLYFSNVAVSLNAEIL